MSRLALAALLAWATACSAPPAPAAQQDGEEPDNFAADVPLADGQRAGKPEVAATDATAPGEAAEDVPTPPDVDITAVEETAPDTEQADLLPTDVPDTAEPGDSQPPSDAAPDSPLPEVAPKDTKADSAITVDPCPDGCDDKNICTVDLCDDVSGCVHTPGDADCDDGEPCTVGEACAEGLCDGGLPKDCDDQNPCTSDTCTPASGACLHAVTKAPCDDGDKCTANDLCWAGGCSGQAITCDDANSCTSDSCDPALGCSYLASDITKGCSDGLKCTAVDTCIGAACIGTGNPCDDKNVCTLDACSEAGGACKYTPAAGPCEDGLGCTQQDQCADGKCVGKAKICDDASPCTADACVPSLGTCSFLPAAGPCDDGDLCSLGGTCLGGNCAAGPTLPCPDAGPCANSACNPATGQCASVGVADGLPCGAVVGCQSDGVCLAGACTAGTGNGCDDANPCTADLCEGEQCVHSSVSGPCDDAKPCTAEDSCLNGACAGQPVSCEDNNPCTAGACAKQSGTCVQSPVLGIPCSDGDACTIGDLCAGGTCQMGLPIDCDDGKPCTDDICNPGGCEHFPQPNGGPCSDGNVCTVGDSCIDQICKAPGFLGCNDANPCTTDVCVPGSGCEHVPQKLDCSDDDCCTADDHCNQGQCVGTGGLACDDGLACTADACTKEAGCLFEPSGGPACSVCTGDDLEGATSQWAAWSDDPTFVQWYISTANPRTGKKALRAQWKGPAAIITGEAKMASIRLRKVLVQGPTWLAFDLSSKVLTEGCTVDTLHVVVNGQELWTQCNGKPDSGGNPLGTCSDYQHVVVDLSAFAGVPVDIDLRLDAGSMAKSGGSMDIDNLQVLGACSPACVGVDLENHDPGLKVTDPPPNYLMPAWPVVSSEPGYLAWKRVGSGGHNGVGALQGAWKGAPSLSQAVTATLSIPSVKPETSAKLVFWARAVGLGDGACGDDDLEVRVGGQQVFSRCEDQLDWKQTVVDLGPWVGQTTAIEFRVRSGASSGAAGLVQVDDIAVTGDCTYQCVFEDFTQGMGEWQTSQAKGVPGWKAADVAYSEPVGLAIELTAGTAVGAKSTLGMAPVLALILPARGAIWRAQAQVQAGQPSCPAAMLTARGQVLGKKVKSGPATGPAMNMAALCEPTPGWTLLVGEFPMGLLGRQTVLQFVASRPPGVAPTLRIDDVEILCR